MSSRTRWGGWLSAGIGLFLLVAAPALHAQQLEIVETIADPAGPQYPVIESGHISGVDPTYGNYAAEYTWAPPPSVIGPEGVSLTLQTQSTNSVGGGMTAGTTLSGSGFSFDAAEPVAWAVVPVGTPGSDSGSLTVHATPTAMAPGSIAELRIAAAWGPGVTYRYRVTGGGEDSSGTTTGGTGDEDTARRLMATVECDRGEIVISELPSLNCRLLISGWRRNTAVPVSVELPLALDGMANHANGLQLLQATASVDAMNWAEPVRNWGFFVFACPGQKGAGVGCNGTAATPGVPASVPIVVRQGDQSVQVTLTLLPVARGGGGAAVAPGTVLRLGSRGRAGDFLTLTSGGVAAGPVRADTPSALWRIEAADPGFVRLVSAGDPSLALNVERGVLAAGPVEPFWHSAMWALEPVEGGRYLRLRNRAREGEYLHLERGAPEVGRVDPASALALWWVME